MTDFQFVFICTDWVDLLWWLQECPYLAIVSVRCYSWRINGTPWAWDAKSSRWTKDLPITRSKKVKTWSNGVKHGPKWQKWKKKWKKWKQMFNLSVQNFTNSARSDFFLYKVYFWELIWIIFHTTLISDWAAQTFENRNPGAGRRAYWKLIALICCQTTSQICISICICISFCICVF